MSVETLSLVITALWLVIYTLDRLCNHDSNDPRNLPLPVGVPSTRLRSSTSSTHIIIQHLHLRIQTNAFNKLHQRLCARFANRRFALAKKSLTVFYDAGSMFGVLGMLGALGIVIWTAGDLVRLLFGWNFTLLVEAGSGYGKRSLDAVAAPTMQTHKSSSGSLLKPIIPGVTVPLAHLPLIFLSILVCQVIHEAGHAVAAALESIPLTHAGFSLSLLVPSAYVSFPVTAADALKENPRARMRIVAGGAWHNLVLYMACLGIGHGLAGMGDGLWGWIGYEDVSSLGKIVLGFEEDSPLRDHLPLGVLITQLDDMPLSSNLNSNVDMWANYLSGSHTYGQEPEGWCVHKSWWMDKSDTCCARSLSDPPTPYAQSCFVSNGSPSELRCLDPIPLLTGIQPLPDDESREDAQRRCSQIAPCTTDSLCVWPREGERLLRIHFLVPEAGQRVILWSGPRREVWEQVDTGTLRPSHWFLPLGLPGFIFIFFEYIQMATLSLFIFNLLPLPFLDGTQMLEAALDFGFGSTIDMHPAQYNAGNNDDDMNLDALEGGAGRTNGRRRRREKWRCRLEKTVKSGTTGLVATCIGLGTINWIVIR